MDRKLVMALGVLATATLGAASSAAAADPGYVTANLNLRAGPGFDYPAVVVMRAGEGVTIYGCLSGWTWCDIDWRGNRGWAAGQYLQVMYQRSRRPITSYGTYIGLPFITFSVDTYWNDHYRKRNFYNQRSRWDHMPDRHDGKPGWKNGNPPMNDNQSQHDNQPPRQVKPINNPPAVGNNPSDNNPPPPPERSNKFKPDQRHNDVAPDGNVPQNGKGDKNANGVQGGEKPDHGPHCPPGQKMVDGACQ